MTALHSRSFARFVALSLVSAALSMAARADDGARPLFAENTIVEVRIEAPLTTFRQDRPEEEYLDGTFAYTAADGTVHEFDLKIRARGRYRLQKNTCNFPPVRLNFRKKQVKDTLFDGQDKLKLVTPCQYTKSPYEQLVLREYLAYRLFNVLTDYSFRVRLLHITWVNTEDDDNIVRWGFVIEDDDDVADRLGLEAKKTPNIEVADLDPAALNLLSVFEYMIGNTDFSPIKAEDPVDCCHNTVPMSADGSPPYIPVPYDFDLSGLVDAPYAAANPRFNLRSVRQRLYRGRCINNAHLASTLDFYASKRDAIIAMVDEINMQSSLSRRRSLNYLESFFDDIMDPTIREKYRQKELTGQCI